MEFSPNNALLLVSIGSGRPRKSRSAKEEEIFSLWRSFPTKSGVCRGHCSESARRRYPRCASQHALGRYCDIVSNHGHFSLFESAGIRFPCGKRVRTNARTDLAPMNSGLYALLSSNTIKLFYSLTFVNSFPFGRLGFRLPFPR